MSAEKAEMIDRITALLPDVNLAVIEYVLYFLEEHGDIKSK